MPEQTALANKVTPYGKLKSLIANEEVQERFATLLGKRAPGFLASVLTIASDPKLIDCEPTSVLNVAAKAAILDLPLDQNLGFAWIVPYKHDNVKVAQFQIGYKGYIQLGLRSGQYKFLNATEIYQGEEVKIDRLSGRIILNGKRTGDVVIGYVAYFCLINGFEKYVHMTTEEVTAHAKKYSKSWGYKDSPWTTSFDWMGKKTVIRRLLSKYGILSIQMLGLIEGDSDDAPIDLGERFANEPNIIDGQATEVPLGTQLPNFDHLKESDTSPEQLPLTNNTPIEQQLVTAGLADNEFNAKALLKKRSPNATLPPFEWARVYRGHRDKGVDSEIAAALANEGKQP